MIDEMEVSKLLDQLDLHCDERSRYIDLLSEIGELGKEILKATRYGKVSFENNDRIKEEYGDCLFSLLAMAFETDIDPEDALNTVLEKYKKRYEKSGQIGSGT